MGLFDRNAGIGFGFCNLVVAWALPAAIGHGIAVRANHDIVPNPEIRALQDIPWA
jgi:hypothetical protein